MNEAFHKLDGEIMEIICRENYIEEKRLLNHKQAREKMKLPPDYRFKRTKNKIREDKKEKRLELQNKFMTAVLDDLYKQISIAEQIDAEINAINTYERGAKKKKMIVRQDEKIDWLMRATEYLMECQYDRELKVCMQLPDDIDKFIYSSKVFLEELKEIKGEIE